MTRSNGARASGTRRVVLLGGKALGIEALEVLLRMPGAEIVAVVACHDDDPAVARWYPSLARFALARGLPAYRPPSVNDERFLGVLAGLQPDLLLSVFYDKILKPGVLELPKAAAVNVHFGLLPYNRGSFPVPWAIIDGNDPGVTLHYMDPGVDTGDVVAQVAVPAGELETAAGVYERCTAAGRYLIERYVPLLLAGRAPRRTQGEGGSYYRPGYPFERWIDWSQDAERLARFVRALTYPPLPSARTTYRGRELEVCHPVWPERARGAAHEGAVVDVSPPFVTVAAGDGLLHVQTTRLGGEELPAAEALGRLGCSPGDQLESVPWVTSKASR
jgi:methionyl-tRNA formyltransferase